VQVVQELLVLGETRTPHQRELAGRSRAWRLWVGMPPGKLGAPEDACFRLKPRRNRQSHQLFFLAFLLNLM
jgi:hypothetical protein